MSYEDHPTTFDGTMRSLDWMALTKLYGVNPNYKSSDDVYSFSNVMSTFIVDGGGIDTINVENSISDVVIDLRPGAHSHMGEKGIYNIAGTIDYFSWFRNRKCQNGSGNDTVIGNIFDNHILTGEGDDIIFSGVVQI